MARARSLTAAAAAVVLVTLCCLDGALAQSNSTKAKSAMPPAPSKAAATQSGEASYFGALGPWTTGDQPPFPAGFPAGSYVERPMRAWSMSPYDLAWERNTPVGAWPVASGVTAQMCLVVAPKTGYLPDGTVCSQYLRAALYKVGITAGPDLVASRGKACVKATAVVRAATGAYEKGSITWVAPAGARDYGEVHVHSFGASDLIFPGDKVCFFVDATVCPTISDLCGPRLDGQCGVGLWSGPGGELIHRCSPASGIYVP